MRRTLTILSLVAVAFLLSTPPALAVTVPPVVTMKDIGTLGGNMSKAFGINNKGQIVGASRTAAGDIHAFIGGGNSQMRDLGTLGGLHSEACGINNKGEVVGWSSLSSGETIHAFIWSKGVMRDLGQPGRTSYANAINYCGQVVGSAATATGSTHAVLWDSSGMKDLGTLGGASSVAYAINNIGQVVGTSLNGQGQMRGFIWEDGTMRDLGSFNGKRSEAYGINDLGQVVGWSDDSSDAYPTRPFLWENGKMTRYPSGGMTQEGAYFQAINNRGRAIGSENTPFGSYPFIALEDFAYPLWPSGTPFGCISQAHAVNDDGVMVGFVIDVCDDDDFRAVVWTVK